jgi:beta-mannanase
MSTQTSPTPAPAASIVVLCSLVVTVVASTLVSPTLPPARAQASSVTVASSSTENPRQHVLGYLRSIMGRKTLAGQHNKLNATPRSATDQVKNITGRAPALWSADFGFGSDQVDHRQIMIDEAIAQWRQGAVIQLMYHNCIPTRDELCSWDEIGGAHPQRLSDQQWVELVTEGSELNGAWKKRLDTLAPFFAQLKAAEVAPLFRPLHEMNHPAVFWWANRRGPQGSSKLFQITHDYLEAKGLDNIIWVWDLQDFDTLGDDISSFNPGPSYYDIAALDVYNDSTGYNQQKHDAIRAAAGEKLIAIGECQTLPTRDIISRQRDWAFFMLWPDFVAQNQGALSALYGTSDVLTLDQLPGWPMAVRLGQPPH